MKARKILYCMGQFACEILKESESSYTYIPLEGYASGQEGKKFTAAKALFWPKRESRGKL